MGWRSKSHKICVDLEAATGLLSRAGADRLILAPAMYSPDPDASQRILAFERSRSRIRKVADVWLKSNDIPKFEDAASRISEAVQGKCDAMYATKPKLVWASIDSTLTLWVKGKAKIRFNRNTIEVLRHLGNWTSWPTAHFRTCHAFLSPTWAKRGLKLRRGLGRSILVTERREPMAFFDPTYDGLDLMADTAWLVELSRAVADATGLPLRMHKNLT